MERVIYILKTSIEIVQVILKINIFLFTRPNICIEREEIDESKKTNSTSNPPQQPANTSDTVIVGAEGDAPVEFVIEDTGSDEVFDSRQSRQFSAHVRMSSCHDEGLSYICETKYAIESTSKPTR